MNDNFELEIPEEENEVPKKASEMVVNDLEGTKNSTVVIEEEDRTVMLTEDETVIIEKEKEIAAVPVNRPRKVYGGMWGNTEIVTVGLGLLAILAVIILYVLVVIPTQKQLADNKRKQDELEAELISKTKKYGSITDTQTQVEKLLTSVNDFETRFLPSEVTGKTALYERLNGLISAYGLINSNGPEYAPLEIVDPNRRQAAENERGRDKLLSIFPGTYVTVTVEGPYQNLRRFIREIETSQQFIMISAVELVPADEQKDKQKDQQNPQPENAGQFPQDNNQRLENIYRGKTSGEIVSLKIEMAAYFRRPGYVPLSTEVSVR